jgi:hypothetical protein
LSYEWANNTFIRSNRNMFVNDYMTNIRTLRRAIKKVSAVAVLHGCMLHAVQESIMMT